MTLTGFNKLIHIIIVNNNKDNRHSINTHFNSRPIFASSPQCCSKKSTQLPPCSPLNISWNHISSWFIKYVCPQNACAEYIRGLRLPCEASVYRYFQETDTPAFVRLEGAEQIPGSCHVTGDRRTATVFNSEHGYLLVQGSTVGHCCAVLWLRGVGTTERQ